MYTSHLVYVHRSHINKSSLKQGLILDFLKEGGAGFGWLRSYSSEKYALVHWYCLIKLLFFFFVAIRKEINIQH